MQNAKCRMQNVHHDLLPSLGRRKERVGGEPTPGRYCGGAVALKKAGGSAFPLPPGSLKPRNRLVAGAGSVWVAGAQHPPERSMPVPYIGQAMDGGAKILGIPFGRSG